MEAATQHRQPERASEDNAPPRDAPTSSGSSGSLVARYEAGVGEVGDVIVRALGREDREGVVAIVRRLEETGALFGHPALSERAGALLEQVARHERLAACAESLRSFARFCTTIGAAGAEAKEIGGAAAGVACARGA